MGNRVRPLRARAEVRSRPAGKRTIPSATQVGQCDGVRPDEQVLRTRRHSIIARSSIRLCGFRPAQGQASSKARANAQHERLLVGRRDHLQADGHPRNERRRELRLTVIAGEIDSQRIGDQRWDALRRHRSDLITGATISKRGRQQEIAVLGRPFRWSG